MEDDDCIVLSSDDEEPRDVQPPKKRSKPSPKEDEDGPSSSNRVNGSSPLKSRAKAEQSEVQCIDIDDDDDEDSNQPSSTSNPEKKATEAVEDLVYKLRNFLKPNERTKVKDKLLRKLKKLDLKSTSIANELVDHIDEVMQKITTNPKHKWANLCDLFTFMNSNKACSSSTTTSASTPNKNDKNETPEERKERKKQEKIVKIEKQLRKIEKAIEKWDKQPVDLDDERNSSYLVKSRMEKKYMEIYELLCRETNCNTYTGRPIEKKIKLPKDVTRYPEINMAVEKFINGKDILFIPDYHDIESIVEDVNKASQPPLLPSSDVGSVAKTLFHQLLKIMRSRRHQDFEISVPLLKTTDDPAEHDEELQKKLEENAKSHKSETEVIESFVQKQLELQEDKNPNEDNADGSAKESDDETDEEEEEEGEEDVEEQVEDGDGSSLENDDEEIHEESQAVVERKIYTRDQAGDTDSEEEEEKENEADVPDPNNVAQEQQTEQKDDKIVNKSNINGESKKVLDTVKQDDEVNEKD